MIKKLIITAAVLFFLTASTVLGSTTKVADDAECKTSSVTETFYFCRIESSCDWGYYFTPYPGYVSPFVYFECMVNGSTTIKSLSGLRTLFSIDGEHEVSITYFFGEKNFYDSNLVTGHNLLLNGIAFKVEVTYNS